MPVDPSAPAPRRFDGPPRVALEPADHRPWLRHAIEAGGGQVVAPDQAEALVWAATGEPDRLARLLRGADHLGWVQLPFAGIEPFVPVLDDRRVWTCGKGVYAEPVAELALTLALAGLRGLGTYARAASWQPPQGRNLLGAHVVILGGGGIAESLIRLLAPWGARVTVVRRTVAPLAGVELTDRDRVIGVDDLPGVLPTADVVVVAWALTPATDRHIDAAFLAAMAPHAWLINVGRGRHVDTDALVAALRSGQIGGAALDVTDPEPLSESHPLWALPNCIITPHVGNTPEMAVPLLGARVTDNVRRFAAGEPLIGPVDVAAGY